MAFIGTAIATAILGATASATAVAVVAGVANAAIGIGVGYLANKLLGGRKEEDEQRGQTLQGGGVVPRAFMLGRGATEGSLGYAGTYGQLGKTPNAYLALRIDLSDLPVAGLVEVIVDGKPVTWNGNASPQIPEYFADGKDHLWVYFYDGLQGDADDLMVEKFGSHPDRPYGEDMLGAGVAYAVVHILVNEELFSGVPKFRFVLDGVPFYDVREDTSAGGSGDQTFGDSSNWDVTRNPIVMAYNVMRGLRYDDEWVFGGQTIAAASLPFASWSAAMSECDAATGIAGGGTEPQFQAGGEVPFDASPLAVIEELLRSCNGRAAGMGGTFKVRVGPGGSAVFAFSDPDLPTTEPKTFEPFPSLDETINGVAASYISPAEGWVPKDAPRLLSPDYEAADGGRRQIADASYSRVSSATQAQRLMASALAEARCFRRHTLPMPPEAFAIEPLDVVAYTSDPNGYAAKLFDAVQVEVLPDGNIVLVIQELDPEAYDWDEEVDELPVIDGPLIIDRPAAQPIVDWDAEPVTIIGDGGRAKAGIRLFWDPDIDDVDGVQFEVRLDADDSIVLRSQTDSFTAGALDISANIIAATEYEVRGRYRPASPRPTTWSDWIAVTTPDVSIIAAELDAQTRAEISLVTSNAAGSLQQVREQARELLARAGSATADALAQAYLRRQAIRANIGEAEARSLALITTEQILRRSDTDALAQQIITILASVGSNTAAIITEQTARADGDTALASQVTALTAVVEGTDYPSVVAAIEAEALVRASDDDALALQVDSLLASVEGTDYESLVAALASESIARADGDSALASDITALDAEFVDIEGDVAASATAITGLTTRVDSAEDAITVQSDAFTALEAMTEAGTASGLFSIAVESAPGGVTARLQMYLRASVGDSFSAAGIFLDILSGGATRMVLLADKFIITDDGTNYSSPMTYSGGTLTLQNLTLSGILIINGTIVGADKLADGSIPVSKLDAQLQAEIALVTAAGGASFQDAIDQGRALLNRAAGATAAGLSRAAVARMRMRIETDAVDQRATAAINTEQVLRESDTEAFAQQTLTITASLAAANAAIGVEQTARADGDTANAAQITVLTATVGANASTASALVATEASARASADTAIAGTVTALDVRLTDAEGDVAGHATALTSLDTRVDAAEGDIDAQATALSALSADVGDNTADIASETTARASADSAMASDITAAEASLATKVSVFRQTSAPTATAAGDLWFDSNDGERQYRWSGSAWVEVSDLNKVTTFTQASAPTAEAVGDVWFESDDNFKPWRWSGSAWVSQQDTRIAANATAITALTTTVSQRARTFVQTAEPTADNAGDLWFDSNDNNKQHRWSGSAWVAVQDLSRAKTFVQAAAPTATAVGDLWVDSDDQNHLYRWSGSAWVSMRDASFASATALTAVEATANQATASGLMKLEAVAAPGGVTARFQIFLRATIGGAYRESGLFIDIIGSNSRIVLQADKTIITDGTTAGTPFVFSGSTLYLQNLAVLGSLIVQGTIVTDRLGADAVTQVVQATADSDHVPGSASTDIFSGTITRLAATNCEIQFNVQIKPYNIPDVVETIALEIYRGSTLIRTEIHYIYNLTGTVGNDDKGGDLMIIFTDTANVSGSQTYRLRTPDFFNLTFRYRKITLREFKR